MYWKEVGSRAGRKERVPKLVVYASLVDDDDDCDLLCIPWLAWRAVLNAAALLSLGRSFVRWFVIGLIVVFRTTTINCVVCGTERNPKYAGRK